MKSIFFACVFISLQSTFNFAQNFDKQKLDSYFEALDEANKFMGSVSVRQNGELIYSQTIGFSDVENNIKATENTKYKIGSISKTFTAVLILKAVEEGKLNLNDRLEKWFPNLQNADKINILNLLNHRSGIHNFTADKNYLTWHTQAKTEEEMLEIIRQAGSDFAPDSRTEYSNSNYVLLTYILEKVLNQSYAELIRNYISEPLGLENTYVFGALNPQNMEAKSYQFKGEWILQPETHPSIPLGAGAIISTAQDVTRFSEALFKAELLQVQSLEHMKNLKDGLGLGLFQIPFYDKLGYGHTGGIDGFSSVFSYFEEDGISYALLSNASHYNNNNISLAVLSAIFDKAYEIPSFTEYQHTAEELEQFVGVYSSLQIPLKINVTKEENKLFAQATGQGAFPLEGTEKNKFQFEIAGIVMEFDPTENRMILYQGGGQFTFTKE